MLRLEARPEVSRAWVYGSPLLALLVTIVVAGLLFVALGKDPVRGLSIFLIEPWANLRGASEIAGGRFSGIGQFGQREPRVGDADNHRPSALGHARRG